MIIGIGTDIIEISRIEKAIKQTESFTNKIFTEKEQDYFKCKNKKAETKAGLFAAKEAVSKALGTGFRGFSPRDIEVVPNEAGKPQVTLLNEAKKLGDTLGIIHMHITISHCKEYAVAYAVAEGEK